MEHLETLSSSTKAQIATDLSEKNMDVCPCNLSGIQKTETRRIAIMEKGER